MKQKDLALILVIAFISGVVSFFASHLLFTSAGTRKQQVETVDAISTDFTLPEKKYFNSDAIDPTQLIQIGVPGSQDPFKSTQQ